MEFQFHIRLLTNNYDYVQHHMVRDDGTTIGSKTIADWRQFCRDVAVNYFARNPKVLGGPGKTVEIDESVITKRKYNRGRLVSEKQWFFGAVERESGEAVIIPIERRNSATLLPLIQRYILPGTLIMSDCWSSYGGIPSLPEGYTHQTVNHSENFIDPVTGAHTQRIESKWQKFKHRHKTEYGTARALLLEYFLWKSEFKGPDEYFHFWSQVLEMYPLNESIS